MSYRLDFHEEVAEDYLEAYTWYEDAKEGLGERLISSQSTAISRQAIKYFAIAFRVSPVV